MSAPLRLARLGLRTMTCGGRGYYTGLTHASWRCPSKRLSINIGGSHAELWITCRPSDLPPGLRQGAEGLGLRRRYR
jgi:hypothetical protein